MRRRPLDTSAMATVTDAEHTPRVRICGSGSDYRFVAAQTKRLVSLENESLPMRVLRKTRRMGNRTDIKGKNNDQVSKFMG